MDCRGLKGLAGDGTFKFPLVYYVKRQRHCEGVLATVAVHLSLQNTEAVMNCCAYARR